MLSSIRNFFMKYCYKEPMLIDDSSLENSSISGSIFSNTNVIYDIEISDDDESDICGFFDNNKELVQSIIEYAKIALETKNLRECRTEIENQFDIHDLEYVDARYIDYTLLNKGGPFWVNLYNFPEENRKIKDSTAINVGLFTFQLV